MQSMPFQKKLSFSTILFMSSYSLEERKRLNLKRFIEIYNIRPQKKLAEAIGEADTNLSSMLAGRRSITDEHIERICNHYNIDPKFFFEDPSAIETLRDTEKHVVERMRLSPELEHRIDIVSESLYQDYRGTVDPEIDSKREGEHEGDSVQKKRGKSGAA